MRLTCFEIWPATAEAQIRAREAADVMSSDDEADFNCKRELNGPSSRKRRIVIDFSDDDEGEENAVNLASPGPPIVQPGSDSLHANGKQAEEKNPSFEELKEDKAEAKHDKSKESNSGLSEQDKSKERNSGLSGCVMGAGNKNDITGISLQKKIQTHIPPDDDREKKANGKTAVASTSPKRRKVLKTRIDERGREGTLALLLAVLSFCCC